MNDLKYTSCIKISHIIIYETEIVWNFLLWSYLFQKNARLDTEKPSEISPCGVNLFCISFFPGKHIITERKGLLLKYAPFRRRRNHIAKPVPPACYGGIQFRAYPFAGDHKVGSCDIPVVRQRPYSYTGFRIGGTRSSRIRRFDQLLYNGT